MLRLPWASRRRSRPIVTRTLVQKKASANYRKSPSGTVKCLSVSVLSNLATERPLLKVALLQPQNSARNPSLQCFSQNYDDNPSSPRCKSRQPSSLLPSPPEGQRRRRCRWVRRSETRRVVSNHVPSSFLGTLLCAWGFRYMVGNLALCLGTFPSTHQSSQATTRVPVTRQGASQ